jgi:hypothetical protein
MDLRSLSNRNMKKYMYCNDLKCIFTMYVYNYQIKEGDMAGYIYIYIKLERDKILIEEG